ncbi:ArsC/Spx/MgsR family protein, partial [Mycobacteroides abscessus]|uniref:ArsC/Spx/MgsR family protein n=1 Tax=Mycobacteroides abscessus TaxID=36809 RepID=UPI000A967482
QLFLAGQALSLIYTPPQSTFHEKSGLGLADASDDALLDAMVAHPRLIQRPFVVTAKGTRMARPTEAVDEIL